MFLVYRHVNNITVFIVLKKHQKKFEKKLEKWEYNVEEDFDIKEIDDNWIQVSAGFNVRLDLVSDSNK